MKNLILVLFFVISQLVFSIESRVAVEIGDQVFTSRYIEIDRSISEYFIQNQKIKVSQQVKSIEVKSQEFIIDWLIAQEAKNLKLTSIQPLDIQKYLDEHKTQIQALEMVKKLEPSDNEIKESIERVLVSDQYLKVKLQNLSSPISDQDIQNYFEKNKNLFDGKKIDNFKENIKVYLMQQQLQERLKSWYESLKRKYKVKIVTGK